METVNIHEAKTQLSRLLARAHAGEEVIISKAGVPYAKLSPLEPEPQRKPGIAKGAVTAAFFDALSDEEMKGWGE